MAKTISFGLSVSEIQKAKKQIPQYQSELNAKTNTLVKRLATIGLDTSKAVIERHRNGDGATLGSARIETTSTGEIVRMSVVVESDAILFLEFGSGITYNEGNENPLASELGYGPGTYPGQTHADDPNGWWYQDDNGEWKHSYGIQADMPMYKASRAMRENVSKIAREVFK